MVKEYFFRGRKSEELKKLSLSEFAELTTAPIRRKIRRGFTEQEKILLDRLKTDNEAKTHCRDMIIIPEMLGKTIKVHSGKEWVPVNVIAEMLGRRLGEFSMTRKIVKHSSPGIGATRSSASMSVR